MEYIINTLIPISFLILLGYFFKYIKFPSEDFWPKADKFAYYILLPALLIYKIATADIDFASMVNLVATVLSTVVVVLLTLMILNLFFKFEARAFTSIVQGGIRYNSYVFLAFVDSIYGDSGLVLAALVMGCVIPFINVMCISTFAIYIQKGEFSFKAFFKTIIKNPFIVACALGGLINYSDFDLPIVALKSLAILSNAALPIGLLSVGVGLDFKYLRSAKIELITSSFAKLIFFPMTIYAIGILFGLSGMTLSVAVIFGAMPTAISGYVLARELGGDTVLMASIITFQTIACMGSLFFIIPIL